MHPDQIRDYLDSREAATRPVGPGIWIVTGAALMALGYLMSWWI